MCLKDYINLKRYSIISFFVAFFAIFTNSICVQAQYVYDFMWTKTNIEVGVGESIPLQYTYSSNTMGTDNLFSNLNNWVFYEYISSINMYGVVDELSVFSVSENGIVTGLKVGKGQIKPTGYILKANGSTERCTINVISQRNEAESNNTFETANELGLIPTRFNLNTIVDQDFFKVYVNKGQHVVFKVKGSNSFFSSFKWAAYAPNYTQIGGGSLVLTNGEREIEIEDWLVDAMGNGFYYLQIYFDPSRPQFYTNDYMTVEAILVDETVDNEVIGDVNGDGRVNVSDVSALINMILGITPMNPTTGDVNGDGHVNVSDVSALINIILGIH